jgi:hypothetical protein
MEPRKLIRTDIAASAIAHLTLVALIIVISEVHPFHAAPPETVAVDIVTPEQVKQEEAKAEEKAQEEKPPEPLPDFKLPKLDVADNDKPDPSPKSAAKEKPAPQQKQAQPSQAAKQQEVNAQPQPQQTQAQQPPAMPQPQATPPAYRVPEPDITMKYGVMLGLPPEVPPPPKDAPKDDGGDAKDSIAAKLPPEVIAELRRHLRSCSKLPAGVAASDAVRIRLRAVMATDGTLARAPILIEAPPSAKGVAIVKSAMSALQACQPYKMLPADKYAEWSVMDLSFTPQDFGS